jgi:hypothetical protein
MSTHWFKTNNLAILIKANEYADARRLADLLKDGVEQFIAEQKSGAELIGAWERTYAERLGAWERT